MSATACGAWPGWSGQRRRGVARVARPRHRSSAATSSIPPGPTATAAASGILGETLKRHAGKPLYVATKIPPKNRQWPARPGPALDDVFPADYIREYTEKSLENIGVPTLDLQQFHVWNDAWAADDRWQRAVRTLKDEGLVKAFGISVNRFEPANVLRALDTGLIDSVQVVYNVLDQNPEDELFPACQEKNIAVIARVPFDEGSLTGDAHRRHEWPDGDFRNRYFTAREPAATLPRVDALKRIVPEGMTHAGAGAAAHPRSIRRSPRSSPGCASRGTSSRTSASATAPALPAALMAELKRHRWDRTVDWE